MYKGELVSALRLEETLPHGRASGSRVDWVRMIKYIIEITADRLIQREMIRGRDRHRGNERNKGGDGELNMYHAVYSPEGHAQSGSESATRATPPLGKRRSTRLTPLLKDGSVAQCGQIDAKITQDSACDYCL